MKKVIKLLFLLSIIPSISNTKINTQSNVEKGYVLNTQKSAPSKYGRVHSEKQISFQNKTSNVRKARQATLPSSYSAVDQGYITSVKNQYNDGTCWTFAASAASEASLIKNNGFNKNSINLSELHLAYFTYNNAYDELGLLSGDSYTLTSDSYLDFGGINYNSMLTYARWTGPADEGKNTNYTYKSNNKSFKPSSTSEAYTLNEAHLKDCYIIDTSDISLMKEMILEYGAGDFGYYHDDNDRYFNDTYDSYCYVQSVNTSSSRFNWANHEVTVVGWDDNFSKTNFNSASRPTNNGAWLVKNSWGASWGKNGYFWLSYEDSSLIAEPTAFYSFDTKDHYEKNYQYDGTSDFYAEYSDNDNEGGYTGGGYMANVFLAQDNENVGAVTFVSFDENIKYDIYVYDNVTSTPTSGTLVSQKSGVETYAGFHTIELDTIPSIKKGNKFAVVVRLTSSSNPSSSITLLCDESYNDTQNGMKTVNAASSGQSYFSTNGSSWNDVSASSKINFRVKALTTSEIVPLESISFEESSISLASGDSYTLNPIFTPSNASNRNLTWESSNPNVATVTNGVIKALNEGSTVITAKSVESANIKASITINVKGITSIELSGTASKNTYDEGDKFDPTGLTVTAYYSDGTSGVLNNSNCEWLDANTNNVTLALGTTSVICRFGNCSATYSGIVVNEVKNYQLVKDVNSLNDGDKVVIAESSKGAVASNLNNTYLNASNASFNSDKSQITSMPSDALIFTLGKNGNTYTFTNDNQKLGATANKKLSFGSGTTSWSINISNNLATIQNSTQNYGRFLYNYTNTRFTTYTSNTSSTMLLPQLYRLPGVSKYLVDLEVKGELIKKEYVVDESFDASGLTINAIYNDGSSIDVTNKVSWSNLTLNSTSVTGNYVEGNITKTITINGLTIKPVTINDLDVSINKNVIDINEVANINVTVTPINTTNKNVTITADKDNIVSINGLNITGINRGEVTLTITSNDNSNISKQLNIKVYSSSFANEVKAAIKEAKNEFSVIRENVRDLSNISTKITNAKELVSMLYEEEKTLISEDINTITSLENAYNFLNNTWYKEEKMDTSKLSKEEAKELVDAYNNLDENTKAILKASYSAKNSNENTSNIEDAINTISKQFTNTNNNSALIIVLVSVGVILVIASVITILLKRKKHIA